VSLLHYQASGIAADACSYYEWQKKASAKVAHFTRLPLTEGHTNAAPPLIFFAGLYDVVQYVSPVESHFQPRDSEDGQKDTREPYPTGNPIPLSTYTILTTAPHKDIRWLHDRMPCVLESWDEISRWLDLGEVKGWEEGKHGTGELLRGVGGLEW
jgi:putative SOS response-associated peptidase YedK